MGLLVLKTAAAYCSNSWDLCLHHICSGAMEHCCQHLGIPESRLWDLIEQVEDATVDVAPLPRQAVALLRANFGSRVLWSQCDLWTRLLTPAAKKIDFSTQVVCYVQGISWWTWLQYRAAPTTSTRHTCS